MNQAVLSNKEIEEVIVQILDEFWGFISKSSNNYQAEDLSISS